MSLIPSTIGREIAFYLSAPAPCPYLDGQVERKLFAHLSGDIARDREDNTLLMRAGFRRSHDIVYRPACATCQACVPVRIAVASFHPSRTMRKTVARNRDLTIRVIDPEPTEEHFALFQAYQAARHADSEMAQMSSDDFAAMLVEGRVATHLYELRDGKGSLCGAVIADHLNDGISAVYSYFDPTQPHRSLGTQLIISLIDSARNRRKPYLYLGYWIKTVPGMSYKGRFSALQKFGATGWSNVRASDYLECARKI